MGARPLSKSLRIVISPFHSQSLKDCTLGMDANTWNAYHLITNRAKAVCASIRQDQFRGLSEITVNKLMQSGKEKTPNVMNSPHTTNHFHFSS